MNVYLYERRSEDYHSNVGEDDETGATMRKRLVGSTSVAGGERRQWEYTNNGCIVISECV